ncbi:MAG: hypothetical protein OER82_01575 [Nitrosopumilus sp.]|nr:hypothetical protein [Nitrosopumilus sp.]
MCTDVEKFLEWLVLPFEKLSQSRTENKDMLLLVFRPALSELYYYIFELLKHYSVQYFPNFDSYRCLALHRHNINYAVISLNYDIIFESAILYAGLGFNYGEPSLPKPIPIAKVHGSINWLNPGHGVAYRTTKDDDVFKIVSKNIFSNRIEGQPQVIIPPGSLICIKRQDIVRSGTDYDVPMLMPHLGRAKDFSLLPKSPTIWRFANLLISDVTELVFVGTSIRKQDELFCKLIKTNVTSKTEITIVRDMEGHKKD